MHYSLYHAGAAALHVFRFLRGKTYISVVVAAYFHLVGRQKGGDDIQIDGACRHLAAVVVGVVAYKLHSARRGRQITIVGVILFAEAAHEIFVPFKLRQRFFAVQALEILRSLFSAGKFLHVPSPLVVNIVTQGRKFCKRRYSTVTDLARLRGLSTSLPSATAVW